MKKYLRKFINWEQNNSTRLLLMAKFTYNNAKNTNTSHILFELNYGYHLKISFAENVNPYLGSCFADKLAEKLRELMEVCCQNLLNV